MPSVQAHQCSNGPDSRRASHDEQDTRKQRGLKLLLVEEDRVV